ncbi:hypothetical protein ACOME3_009743 [Neoechinorhynchus agilis]
MYLVPFRSTVKAIVTDLGFFVVFFTSFDSMFKIGSSSVFESLLVEAITDLVIIMWVLRFSTFFDVAKVPFNSDSILTISTFCASIVRSLEQNTEDVSHEQRDNWLFINL